MADIEQIFKEALDHIENMFQNLEFEDDSELIIKAIEDSRLSIGNLNKKVDEILELLKVAPIYPPTTEKSSVVETEKKLMSLDDFLKALSKGQYVLKDKEKMRTILQKFAPPEAAESPLKHIPQSEYANCLAEFEKEFK